MQLTTNGHPLDTSPAKFGELADSSDLLGDSGALREALREHGYLFFRRLLDPEVVDAARREILTKYAVLGEIETDFLVFGIWAQTNHRFHDQSDHQGGGEAPDDGQRACLELSGQQSILQTRDHRVDFLVGKHTG